MGQIVMGIAIVLLVVGVVMFIVAAPMKENTTSVRLTELSTVVSRAGIMAVIVAAHMM